MYDSIFFRFTIHTYGCWFVVYDICACIRITIKDNHFGFVLFLPPFVVYIFKLCNRNRNKKVASKRNYFSGRYLEIEMDAGRFSMEWLIFTDMKTVFNSIIVLVNGRISFWCYLRMNALSKLEYICEKFPTIILMPSKRMWNVSLCVYKHQKCFLSSSESKQFWLTYIHCIG